MKTKLQPPCLNFGEFSDIDDIGPDGKTETISTNSDKTDAQNNHDGPEQSANSNLQQTAQAEDAQSQGGANWMSSLNSHIT